MSTAVAPPPALCRLPGQGPLGGVCAGIAARAGLDVVFVRLAFVVATAAGGLGAAAYGLAWFGLPTDADPHGAAARGRPRRGRGAVEVTLGVALLLVAALLTVRAVGLPFSDALAWPLVLVLSGAALLWRTAGPVAGTPAPPAGPAALWGTPGTAPLPAPADTGTRWAAPGAAAGYTPLVHPPHGSAAYAFDDAVADEPRAARVSRTSLGVALVLGAGVVFLQVTGALGAVRDVALAAGAVAVALAVIFAPWVARLTRGLSAERAARIRSQERAEVAAHLHDSVLQTLALVQKRADDPRAVAALARTQERELRAWLSGDVADPTHLVAALQAVAGEVERDHGVRVEVVGVGDLELGERTAPLVAAAREAMVNAAKFAGDAGAIDVFAEIDRPDVRVYVRDRGPGFDPAAATGDRRGVRDSIVGRMERHGGRAELRPAAGGGTEVLLATEVDG